MMMRRFLTRVLARPASLTRPRKVMVRRWVETANERCPLACVWLALPGTQAGQTADESDDQPHLPWPVFFNFQNLRSQATFVRRKTGRLTLVDLLPLPFSRIA